MFSLTLIKQGVRLSSQKLRHDTTISLITTLNQQYANKVIIGIGLAISVWDIVEVGDPLVDAGESMALLQVSFRIIVFRPFSGQILVGRIRRAGSEGLSVSLPRFFDDILIPPQEMPSNTVWDPVEQTYSWLYDDNKMFLDVGEQIRFRCIGDSFYEGPNTQPCVMMSDGGESSANTTTSTIPTFKIIASIAEDGLGLTSWWLPQEEEKEEEEEEEK